MRRLLSAIGLLVFLAACGAPQSASSIPAGTSSSRQPNSHASGSCCNIYWNKKRLSLKYASKSSAKATLTYWAPNGYFFDPVECQHGSQISVDPRGSWGDPSGYEHVIVKFTARSAGPDQCAITAVLNGTGSPPLASLRLRIK
jgi:hypothetical protein